MRECREWIDGKIENRREENGIGWLERIKDWRMR